METLDCRGPSKGAEVQSRNNLGSFFKKENDSHETWASYTNHHFNSHIKIDFLGFCINSWYKKVQESESTKSK